MPGDEWRDGYDNWKCNDDAARANDPPESELPDDIDEEAMESPRLANLLDEARDLLEKAALWLGMDAPGIGEPPIEEIESWLEQNPRYRS